MNSKELEFTREELLEIKDALELRLILRLKQAKAGKFDPIYFKKELQSIIKKVNKKLIIGIVIGKDNHGVIWWARSNGETSHGFCEKGLATIEETKDWLINIKFPNSKLKFKMMPKRSNRY